MNILTFSTAIICAAVIGMLLRQYKPELSIALTVGVSAGALLLVMPYVNEIITFLHRCSSMISVSGSLKPLIKALGTAFIAELAYDICCDAGEQAMAKKIELAGRVAIIIMALPLANDLLRLISGLI